MAGLQQLEHFVEQTALRHVQQQLARGRQRLQRLGVEGETQTTELGGKTHGADDAHRVFAVARGGVANHAQRLLLRVADPVVEVDHGLRLGVVVHGVDAEVAASSIVFDRTPHVVAQHTAAGVHRVFHAGEFALAGALVAGHLLGVGAVQVGAEGRHLDHFVFAAAAVDHVNDTEAPADDESAAEQAS